MSKIIQLKGPHGIPLWFQKLHGDIPSVSLRWTVFVGSADDERVGKPGLYHWFEHVPFRGTRKYPGGYQEIDLPLARHGGHVDASTTEIHTSFEVSTSKRRWHQAMDTITELVCSPLLRSKDIHAERDIIRQEIIGCHSEADEYTSDRVSELLYPGHPFGHPIFGSTLSLDSMNASLLRKAYREGYDRSRMAFFAAGDIPEKELVRAFEKACGQAPNHGLPERRCGAVYGPIPPWKAGLVSEEKTSFPSTSIYFIFPLPSWKTEGENAIWLRSMAQEMLSAGELASPIYAVLRDEENLVYDIDSFFFPYADGGHWGFSAETNLHNAKYVVESFWKAVRSRKVRARERYDYVRDTIRGRRDTYVVDPDKIVDGAQDSMAHLGRAYSNREIAERLLDQPYEKVTEILEEIGPKFGRTILFKGSD